MAIEPSKSESGSGVLRLLGWTLRWESRAKRDNGPKIWYT